MLGLRIVTAAWLHGLRVAFVLIAVTLLLGLHLAAVAAVPALLLLWVAPHLLAPLAWGLGLLAAALALPIALGIAAQTAAPLVEGEDEGARPVSPIPRLSVIKDARPEPIRARR